MREWSHHDMRHRHHKNTRNCIYRVSAVCSCFIIIEFFLHSFRLSTVLAHGHLLSTCSNSYDSIDKRKCLTCKRMSVLIMKDINNSSGDGVIVTWRQWKFITCMLKKYPGICTRGSESGAPQSKRSSRGLETHIWYDWRATTKSWGCNQCGRRVNEVTLLMYIW